MFFLAVQAQNITSHSNDVSFLKLFLEADIVVQSIMAGLFFASIWCWVIIFEKYFSLRKTSKDSDLFERVFWSGESLDELYQQLTQRKNHSMAAIFVSAMREWKRSVDSSGKGFLPGVQMRVQKAMDVTLTREVERLENRLMFLATVGSTAPFVGLFGTVWGIMSSFQAIANTKNTSLAVVAPGIAEALFATALGLMAAIPAVIFYNKFSHEVSRHAMRMETFSDEFTTILSRQADMSEK